MRFQADSSLIDTAPKNMNRRDGVTLQYGIIENGVHLSRWDLPAVLLRGQKLVLILWHLRHDRRRALIQGWFRDTLGLLGMMVNF